MEMDADVRAAVARYLLEVSTYLGSRTPKERRELLAELEDHIHEALSRRSREPTLNDLAAVLAEMAPPESYAAPLPDGLPVAGAAGRKAGGLGPWALGLALGGIVLAVVVGTLGGRQAGEGAAFLLIILELIALAFGIVSWRSPLGKAAVGIVVIVAGGCVLAYFNFTARAVRGPAEERTELTQSASDAAPQERSAAGTAPVPAEAPAKPASELPAETKIPISLGADGRCSLVVFPPKGAACSVCVLRMRHVDEDHPDTVVHAAETLTAPVAAGYAAVFNLRFGGYVIERCQFKTAAGEVVDSDIPADTQVLIQRGQIVQLGSGDIFHAEQDDGEVKP
jgi:hypothetical protein